MYFYVHCPIYFLSIVKYVGLYVHAGGHTIPCALLYIDNKNEYNAKRHSILKKYLRKLMIILYCIDFLQNNDNIVT